MSIQSMYNLKEEKASKQGVSTRILVNGSQIVEFLLKKICYYQISSKL